MEVAALPIEGVSLTMEEQISLMYQATIEGADEAFWKMASLSTATDLPEEETYLLITYFAEYYMRVDNMYRPWAREEVKRCRLAGSAA